jgi:hypothetical protein
MDGRRRALAATSAAEAACLVYGALVAFTTASPQSGHDLLLGAILLGLATPLAWYSATAFVSSSPQPNSHSGRILLPNAALLVLCFTALLPASNGSGLWPALIAVLAATVAAAALRWGRDRESNGLAA